ncbi:MAG: SDR family NAD(P)-dependent oxidoreductase [Deltaproteobacteria bacterium]|nr:SDR family NAD(P)-dependent oxidoreductase [Deltaproteobacteria bacterium]
MNRLPAVARRSPVIVITGASTGIGRALAFAWAARAARLVLNARSVDALEEVAATCRVRGADAVVVPGDITSAAVQEALVEGARTHFQSNPPSPAGGIDVLVNNAGVGLYGTVDAIAPAMLREVFELNVVAPLRVTQLALPALEAARGTVVMMSSIAGLVAMPRTGGYAATKFALEALSWSLRAELEAQGRPVRLCVVRPGLTETPFAENARVAEGSSTRSGMQGVPRMSAEEVAQATLRAVDRGDPEVNLTFAARAMTALGRLSRPALRAVLTRMAPRLGVPRGRG